jgi:tetratricopeptide (TPR) repeat protein
MKIKGSNKAIILIFSLALGGAAATANAKGPGSSSANFLKMGVGGRGVSMGEAQTATSPDAMTVYWNPAGLAELTQNEVAFMRNNYFQSIHHDVLYYVQPTRTMGSLAAGLSRLSVDGINGYDESGVKTGDLAASDTLASLAWGKSWEEMGWFGGLKTGASVKFLQKKLGQDSATAPMLDLGFLYEAREGLFQRLRSGFVVQNLGSGIQFESEKSDLPRIMKLGLAYPIFSHMTVASDMVLPSDNDMSLNFGFEYRLWNLAAFRLGHNGRNDLDSGLTYGAGFGNERLHLDYAFVPFGKLGDSHRVSLGFRFGKNYKKAQVQDQIRQAYEKAEARYAQGYLVEAYMQANQIVGVAPWHRPSRVLMRRIQQEFKDLEDASRREHLQIQIDEHFSRGEQHFLVDELVPARREFDAILALQPGHVGAKTYLKRIEDRFSGLAQTFYETGMRYFASGDYKLAKEQFQKVLVINPEHLEAREQLTRTEGLMVKAETEARQREVLETVRPIYHAGLAAFQKEDYSSAMSLFEDVLRLDPENAEAKRYRSLSRDILAKAAYQRGNEAAQAGEWPTADRNYREAIRLKPDHPEARAALEKVRSRLGTQRKDESQTFYKEGLEAFLGGDPDKARSLWEKAVELDPENLEAKRGLERISERSEP